MMAEWTFDIPSGTCTSKELTLRLTGDAMTMAGVSAIESLSPSVSGYSGTREKFDEHWVQFTLTMPLSDPGADAEILLHLTPSLAALIKLRPREFVLLPELRALIPTNLGKQRVVGWYALTMPSQPVCAVPKRHAPGCECAPVWNAE